MSNYDDMDELKEAIALLTQEVSLISKNILTLVSLLRAAAED